jgi:hypothetical protein
MSTRVLLLLPALLVLLGTPAAAQSVKVKSDGAVLQPAPAAIKVAYERLKPGTVLEVIETTGDWYRVRVVGTNREGYVLRAEVEPVAAPGTLPRSAPGAGVTQKQPAQPIGSPRPSGKPGPSSLQKWIGAGYIAVSGIYQGGSSSFTDSFEFPQYVEQAHVSASYPALNGVGVDGGGWFRIWKGLGVGVAASWFARTGSVGIDASIPHPLYLSRDRQITGSSSIRREEIAAHVQGGWVITAGPRLVVTVGGGPSWFSVKQDVVQGVRWSETYPYDTATFTESNSAGTNESALGWNAALDVGFYFTRNFGIGGLVRFSRARVPLASPSGASTIDAGGVQAGVGMRLRFPSGAPPARPAATGGPAAPPPPAPRPAARAGTRPQPPPTPPPLTGMVTRAVVESFDDVWKALRAQDYEPDASAVTTIRQKAEDVDVFIVIATWCSDTRRDLPRFFKIADQAGWPAERITMLGVDRTKRDPEGQTVKWDVTKVSTFIFIRRGREIGRVVEKPTTTLEQDIAQILSRE